MERHRFDPLSFVFGAVLTLVAVVGLTDLVALRLADLRWAGPGLLVLLGLVLVLTAGRGPDRRQDGRPDDVDHPAGAGDHEDASHALADADHADADVDSGAGQADR